MSVMTKEKMQSFIDSGVFATAVEKHRHIRISITDYECSVCKWLVIETTGTPNYCSHCGTEFVELKTMEGETIVC
jgi:rubredoxin